MLLVAAAELSAARVARFQRHPPASRQNLNQSSSVRVISLHKVTDGGECLEADMSSTRSFFTLAHFRPSNPLRQELANRVPNKPAYQ